ncbi:MAG: FAD:protein FMN transferase [Bdellovibrionales bacterium]|nr:FAD:protein FMN transferase [Ramlibacter sp.]
MQQAEATLLRRARPLLGTLVEVTCAHEDEPASRDRALAASQAAFDAALLVHRLMSRHEAGSDLSRFNAAAAGQWVEVDAHTTAVFSQALELAALSGGVFDVCAVGGAQAPGTWRDIEIDSERHALRKQAPLQADLGGIAKGHAVDAAVEALERNGVQAGWVNAGGDLRVFGAIEVPVCVRDPRDLSRLIECTRLSNGAAATSATYFADAQGAHEAAASLRHGVTRALVTPGASWTVAAPRCMLADALTKLVAATGDATHPLLAHYAAKAWIY